MNVKDRWSPRERRLLVSFHLGKNEDDYDVCLWMHINSCRWMMNQSSTSMRNTLYFSKLILLWFDFLYLGYPVPNRRKCPKSERLTTYYIAKVVGGIKYCLKLVAKCSVITLVTYFNQYKRFLLSLSFTEEYRQIVWRLYKIPYFIRLTERRD